VNCGLTGWVHFIARLDDIAHDDSFHLVGAKSGAGDCGVDCRRSEAGSGNVFETAAEGADGGADRFGENDCTLLCHGRYSCASDIF
jgi:hypothetical protein